MTLDYSGVNWVAVVVAAVANVVIGFVWYLPQVFGNRWASETGRPLPQTGQIPVTTYVAGVVIALIVAYVLALLAGAVGAATLVDGATLGFFAWLGFAAPTTASGALYEGRSTTWWAINAGFILVALVVMGAIIGYLA